MKSTFRRRVIAVGLVCLATATVAVAQPPAKVEWSLEDVITTSIAQHPLVEAARARIAAATGSRVTAGMMANPIATVWLENAAFPGQQLPSDISYETSTYFTLPLEPLFQRSPRIKRADEEIRAAESDVRVARRQVALDATQAFFRVAFAQVALDAAEENRSGIQSLVTYNQSRVHEGATPEIDLIRAQIEFDRAATNAVLAQVELSRSRAELWPFISADPSIPAFHVVLPQPGAAGSARPVLTAVLAQARQTRPELVAARARVGAATAETEYQRRLTVRQLGATVGFKNIGGSSLGASSNSLIAGITVPLPIFNRNTGDIQRAEGELAAAQQTLTWQERTITATVQGAYDAAERLADQVSQLQGPFLSRADEANRITVAAYQEGAATLLQVLDVSRALADARLTYYRALFVERQSRFELALAAGNEPSAALAMLAATGQLSSDVAEGASR